MRKIALPVATLALVTAGALVIPQGSALAYPNYCTERSWAYADSQAGLPRLTTECDYYNDAFLDYNNCNDGQRACNDYDIPCENPPV